MSSITFQSISDEARVGGSERAHGAHLTKCLYQGLLDLPGLLNYNMTARNKRAALARLAGLNIDADEHFSSRISRDRISFWISPVMCSGEPINLDGWEFHPWYAELNTSIKFGSDAVAFMARLHAQCEIHGYVPEEERPWLAELIEQGLDQKLFREETQGYGNGWRDVVALLRNGDGGPVVSQYSVCDSFMGTAGSHILKNPNDDDWERWDDTDQDEWWPKAVEWLTGQEDGGPVWTPKTLRMPFGDGEDALGVRENLEKAIKAEMRPPCEKCEGYGKIFTHGLNSVVCEKCQGTGEAQ